MFTNRCRGIEGRLGWQVRRQEGRGAAPVATGCDHDASKDDSRTRRRSPNAPTSEFGFIGVDESRLRYRRATLAEIRPVACYRVRKYIGAYLAALGRCDAIVFTGGIGEHSATVRFRSLVGLDALGISIDAERNTSGVPVISATSSPIAVAVVPTDEEGAIARQVAGVVGGPT